MGRFNISGVARGLTTYAIERQNGWERHQPEGAPPRQDQRRLWTDAILQGMARLEEQVPDPKLMEQFDRELEQASGSAAAVPAPLQLQRGTIQNLRNFVTALEDTGDDRRRQINVVRELLEDMASHLPWAGKSNRLDLARDEAERSLVRMTAQMPIRFTHIALGGDAGPYWEAVLSPALLQTPRLSNSPRCIKVRFGITRRSQTGPPSAWSMWGGACPPRLGRSTLLTSTWRS